MAGELIRFRHTPPHLYKLIEMGPMPGVVLRPAGLNGLALIDSTQNLYYHHKVNHRYCHGIETPLNFRG